jgi:23S rRNA (guanosine2251-2'-O)-methyltransferase
MARNQAGRQAPRTTPPRGGKARMQKQDEERNARPKRGKGAYGKDAPRGKGSYGKGKGPDRTRAPRRDDRGPRVSKDRLIEGRRAADEALAAGVPIRRAFIATTPSSQDPKLANLGRELEAMGVAVDYVSKGVLDRMSSHGAHQGVVLETEAYRYAELADIIAASGTGNALVIVLDHVTDEGNFGAIVRSAEVVGAAGVVIAKARAASVGVGAYKTSAGAVMHVPIAQVSNLATAIDELKEAGFWVGAATEHAKDLAWDAPMGGRIALVMGNEQTGVSRLVLDRADFSAKLPVAGRVESLNVAQATTAMAYEWLRQTMAADGADGLDAVFAQDEAVVEAEAADQAAYSEDAWESGSATSFFFDASDIEALS